MNDLPTYRASNLLYDNAVEDFAHAMQLVIEQCEDELPEARKMDADSDFVAEFGLSVPPLESLMSAARRCLKEWQGSEDHDALAERWQGADCEDVQAIGYALETGDYSGLAI